MSLYVLENHGNVLENRGNDLIVTSLDSTVVPDSLTEASEATGERRGYFK